MAKRAQFHVSTEAILRRLVHATDKPMALAAFSRVRESAVSPLRCDYVLGSRAWNGDVRRGTVISSTSFPAAPSAVGQTVRGVATIEDQAWNVQAVGCPAYPGRVLPRVLSLIEPPDTQSRTPPGLVYKVGDLALATEDGSANESVIVAHVVNDTARAWGRRGVAAALTRVVPDAARAFKAWTIASPDNLVLGNVHVVTVQSANGVAVTVASLIAQAGYGPSPTPRLSYVKLAESLDALARTAERAGATVYMPRIGAGQGGGRWDLVEAAIERSLLTRGVRVVVFTLPSAPGSTKAGE
jgi:O-acetyl-ADP-ribose deacetylase (regulator of RNase III)